MRKEPLLRKHNGVATKRHENSTSEFAASATFRFASALQQLALGYVRAKVSLFAW
jgi:hypothetical protein